MKILYVVSRSPEINSSASIRNSAFIHGLKEIGHDVTLLTTIPDRKSEYYDKSLMPDDVKIKYIEGRTAEGVLNWAKQNPLLKPLKKTVARIVSKVEIYDTFKWFVDYTDEVDFREYDCVISSSDPKSSHLFMYEAVKKHGKMNWIQIWGDPFCGDISRSKELDIDALEKEERKLLQYAVRVYYVSELTLIEQKDRYPEFADKMNAIPIPYLKERIYDLDDLSKKGVVELCYCGDYPSRYRNIVPLYEAVSSMEGVHLTISGASDIKLKSSAKVTVLTRQTYDKVEKIEDNADILIHICNSHGTQIPGKIYQYSGTNKPILFILDGEKEIHRKQFEKYRRYKFCENEADNIRNAIESVISSNIYFDTVKEFERKNIVKRMALG